MYITERSTMQAKKVKVNFINTRKKYMQRMQWQMIPASRWYDGVQKETSFDSTRIIID